MLKAVSFFVRPYNGDPAKYKHILQVNHERIVSYAKCMELVVGPELLKSNLHAAVCRLRD